MPFNYYDVTQAVKLRDALNAADDDEQVDVGDTTGALRLALGRTTSYVSARFSTAAETCKVRLVYRDADDGFVGVSDERTLVASAIEVDMSGGGTRFVAIDEMFDLACVKYEVLVTDPPGAGTVDIWVREA